MPTPRLPAAAARRCVAPHPRVRIPPRLPTRSALGGYGLRALNFNGWDGEGFEPNSSAPKPEFYR